MELIRFGATKAARRRRPGGHTIFICVAGILIALAGLSGCGSSTSNSAQNGSPSSSPSCSTAASIHRSGHVRAGQPVVLAAALVPMVDIPPPDIDLDGPRPADQTNEVEQEQEQDNWANQGLDNADGNPESSQAGNSTQQESDAVAEKEEVTLWTDDLTEPDTFGEQVCEDIESLSSNAENLDNLNQLCSDIQQISTGAASNALCGVILDANNQFDQVFGSCNGLQVTEWLLDTLSKVFCITAPSG